MLKFSALFSFVLHIILFVPIHFFLIFFFSLYKDIGLLYVAIPSCRLLITTLHMGMIIKRKI